MTLSYGFGLVFLSWDALAFRLWIECYVIPSSICCHFEMNCIVLLVAKLSNS